MNDIPAWRTSIDRNRQKIIEQQALLPAAKAKLLAAKIAVLEADGELFAVRDAIREAVWYLRFALMDQADEAKGGES